MPHPLRACQPRPPGENPVRSPMEGLPVGLPCPRCGKGLKSYVMLCEGCWIDLNWRAWRVRQDARFSHLIH